MADAINNKKSYLREVQQEQAQKKRELMSQQKEDMQKLREYYAEERRRIDSDSSAAVNHIKNKSAEENREARLERMERTAEERETRLKQAEALRDEKSSVESPASRKNEQAESQSVERKQLYNRKAQTKPSVQNYETRESDDFYRVQDRGSRVSESNNGYVIEAYAPEHEKDNLRVSINRDRAVISGQRKFEDQAQDGNKTMRTNNFQTFREEFKLGYPVSSDGITRERIGDYVRFTIPKLAALNEPESEA